VTTYDLLELGKVRVVLSCCEQHERFLLGLEVAPPEVELDGASLVVEDVFGMSPSVCGAPGARAGSRGCGR
jgi:hypothetical protein